MFVLLVATFSQSVEAGKGKRPAGNCCESKEDLKLSPEQEKKLQSLKLNFEKEITKLSSEIRTQQLELQELWTADTPDENKINTKIDEIAKLRAEIEKKRTSHLLEVKKVLTEEQWSKFKSRPGFCGEMPAGPGPKKKWH
jgi:Spy/CpxP family protein refolding chaperone